MLVDLVAICNFASEFNGTILVWGARDSYTVGACEEREYLRERGLERRGKRRQVFLS